MIFCLFILNLFAMDVMVQSKASHDLEYQKYVNENPEKISFVSHLLQEKSKDPRLTQFLKQGQFEFLKGSLDNARKEFQKIVDLSFKEEWNKEQREIINYAFLRRAQLEKDPVKQKEILLLSLSFDPSSNTNEDLFPPPLIQKRNDLKKGLRVQVWALPEKTQQFDQVFVNGKKIDFSSGFLKKAPGLVRVSFYSNKWRPQSFQLKTSELQEVKLPLIPLVKGSCHNPTFNTESLTHRKLTLFDQGCTGTAQKQLAGFAANAETLDFPKEKETQTKLYENKWLWIGLSIVAVGLTAYQIDQNNQKGSGSAQPTKPSSSANSDPVVFGNQ